MTAQTALPGYEDEDRNGQHSMDSSEWYSPSSIVTPARNAMGQIDLDPASCLAANELIQAHTIYTEESDGLAHAKDWVGNVFLNPPNPPRPWWDALIVAHKDRRVELAVYVAYSIEQLQQSQKWEASMFAFPVCIPSRRVPYLCTAAEAITKLTKRVKSRVERERKKKGQQAPTLPEAEQHPNTFPGWTRAEVKRLLELEKMPPTQLVLGTQPPHASAIVGVGWDEELFAAAYGSLGECVRSWRPR